MTQIIVLPHVELCPDGAVIEARVGESICQNLLENGVAIEHAAVTRLFSATQGWFGFRSSDVWTLFHSVSFDFSVWEIWGALLHGGRLVIVPESTTRPASST